LKIPGFSNYLHPVGDGLLLGVGQDATDQGVPLGTQVSLFDVTDLSDPKRIAVETVAGGHSPVEYDHRAFLWWPPEGLAVLPLEVQPWAFMTGPEGEAIEPFVGAAAFRIEGREIVSAGRIAHTTGEEIMVETMGLAHISRSLVIGEILYTVSDAGVLASSLDGLEEVGRASFRSP
jgi:hypothetical protein